MSNPQFEDVFADPATRAAVTKPDMSARSERYVPAMRLFEITRGRGFKNTNTQPTKLTLELLLKEIAEHRLSEIKDGAWIIGGNYADGATGRNDASVRGVELIQFDFDKGDWTFEALQTLMQEKGCAYAIYSTFSHLEDGTTEKFRVAVPFAGAFTSSGSAADIAQFKRAYTALAKAWFGDSFDASCKNIARLFYTAAAPEDRFEQTQSTIVTTGVDLFDFNAFILELPAQPERIRRKKVGAVSPERAAFDLVWPAIRAHFNAAEFARAYDDTVKDTSDKAETFCPFNDEHGTPDTPDKTPVVWYNADDATHETATVVCAHATCKDAKKTAGDFVFAVMEENGVAPQDLGDFVTSDGEAAFDKAMASLPPTTDEMNGLFDGLSEADGSEKDDAADKITRRLAAMPAGTVLDRCVDRLVAVSGRKLARVKSAIREERKSLAAQENSAEDDNVIYPSGNFDDALNQTCSLFSERNTQIPRVFYSPFLHDYARIEPTQERASLERLSNNGQWIHELRSAGIQFKNTQGSISPPPDLIAGLRGNPALGVPTCSAIVRVPVFSRGGALRTVSGFDAESGTYLQPWGDFKPCPHDVSSADVSGALALLNLALRDMPFSDVFDGVDALPVRAGVDDENFPAPNYARGESSRANAFALLLSPIARGLIYGSTPIHLIDKPKPGTGAGFLLDLLSTIVDGKRAAVTPLAKSEEEIDKQITAKLATGDQLQVYDNVSHHVVSASLAAGITAGTWKGRILGQSAMTDIPVSVTWAFAANHGSFSPELMRRTVPIRLDAATDDPARDRPPVFYKMTALGFTYQSWLRAHRLDLVWAVHVIVRNWLQMKAAGYEYEGPVLASFEEYSDVVGGILTCAGVHGFLANTEPYMATRNDEQDVDRLALAALFEGTSDAGGTFDVSTALSILEDPVNQGGALRFDILPAVRVGRQRQSEGTCAAVGLWLKKMAEGGVHRLPSGDSVTLTRSKLHGRAHYYLAKK